MIGHKSIVNDLINIHCIDKRQVVLLILFFNFLIFLRRIFNLLLFL